MTSSKRSIHSRKRSTEALEPLEDLLLGDCTFCNRPLETFCIQCQVLICPNCLMFGAHKGHETQHPSLAARQLRADIDRTNKEGRMKPEWTDGHLNDIMDRQSKSEQLQQTVIDSIEKNFSTLVETLKKRRTEVNAELDAEFSK